MRSRWTASTALFFLVCCTFFVALGVMAYGVWQDWENNKAVAIQKTLNLAHTCTERQKTFTSNTEMLLRTLVNVPVIIQGDPPKVGAFLRKLDTDQPDYAGFALFRPDGKTIAATLLGKDLGDLDPEIIRKREYFTRALEQRAFAIGEFLPAPGAPEIPTLTMSMPVENAAGQVVAVAMAPIDFRRFDSLITGLVGKSKDSVQIFDRRRVLIYCNQPEHKQILGSRVDDPHILQLMDSPTEVGSKTNWAVYTTPKGITMISALVKLQTSPTMQPYMYVYVTSPLPPVWNFLTTRYLMELGGMVLTLLGALLLAYYLGNRLFSRGLEKLAFVAQNAEEGDYSIRTGAISGCHEIQVLAQGFDAMLDVLERNTTLLEHERAYLNFALDGARMGTWEWEPASDCALMDNRSLQLLGYSPRDLPALEGLALFDPRERMHPDDRKSSQSQMQEHLEGSQPYYRVEVRMQHKDGRWIWVSLQGRLEMLNLPSCGPRVFGICMDITQRKHLEELEQEKAAHYLLLSNTDPLTGLSNRRHFMEEALLAMQRARRDGHPVTVVMADIDYFKKVNDTYGHAVGDIILQAFSAILRKATRATDLVGRYGGEEFVFFLPETHLGDATTLMEKIRVHLEQNSVPASGNQVRFTASFGLCTCTPRPFTAQGGSQENLQSLLEALIACADSCLYRAKAEGRNRVVYEEAMLDSAAFTKAGEAPNAPNAPNATEEFHTPTESRPATEAATPGESTSPGSADSLASPLKKA